MVKSNIEWIVQTRTDNMTGWSETSITGSYAAGRDALAGQRRSEPQYLHRLVRREPGCIDTILTD